MSAWAWSTSRAHRRQSRTSWTKPSTWPRRLVACVRARPSSIPAREKWYRSSRPVSDPAATGIANWSRACLLSRPLNLAASRRPDRINRPGASTLADTTFGLPTPIMRRFWLLFSQAVTILLAAYFVVATLKPEWLGRPAVAVSQGVPLVEAPAPLTGAPPMGSFRLAAQRASAAVVSINTSKAAERHPNASDPWFRFFFGDQGGAPQAGLGSGVIISADGYILTNNHVVEGADEIEAVLNDSRRARAKVIGTDPDTDLAILKISLERLPVITLGNSDALQVGDQVLAIGNPFGV